MARPHYVNIKGQTVALDDHGSWRVYNPATDAWGGFAKAELPLNEQPRLLGAQLNDLSQRVTALVANPVPNPPVQDLLNELLLLGKKIVALETAGGDAAAIRPLKTVAESIATQLNHLTPPAPAVAPVVPPVAPVTPPGGAGAGARTVAGAAATATAPPSWSARARAAWNTVPPRGRIATAIVALCLIALWVSHWSGTPGVPVARSPIAETDATANTTVAQQVDDLNRKVEDGFKDVKAKVARVEGDVNVVKTAVMKKAIETPPAVNPPPAVQLTTQQVYDSLILKCTSSNWDEVGQEEVMTVIKGMSPQETTVMVQSCDLTVLVAKAKALAAKAAAVASDETMVRLNREAERAMRLFNGR